MKLIKKYHDAIIRSIITYGAFVWCHRMSDVKQRQIVNRAQRQLLVRMLKAHRITPVEALQIAAATVPYISKLNSLELCIG